ncbi:MAG: hypothetical protein ABSG21_10705 [Spirochaetia bacterium]|jgi:hypothetical protein
MRIAALAATVLSLTGCFVFDSPYDKTPSATLQIVLQGGSYPATYIWNTADSAYEAVVGGTLCSVYIDSSGTWHLTHGAGNVIASSTGGSYARCTLPPTTFVGWSGSGSIVSEIDDSVGGISIQGLAPDIAISTQGQILQVAFQASSPGNSATYQWQKSPTSAQSFDSPIPIGTGSTYTLKSGDYAHWFRVIITPTDSTGAIQGTPVASQPVDWP